MPCVEAERPTGLVFQLALQTRPRKLMANVYRDGDVFDEEILLIGARATVTLLISLLRSNQLKPAELSEL